MMRGKKKQAKKPSGALDLAGGATAELRFRGAIYVGLILLFLGLITYVISRNPELKRLPHVGDTASTDYVSRIPVECKMPNPDIQEKRRHARDAAPAVYSLVEVDFEKRDKYIRDAFERLGKTLDEAEDLEKEVAMLQHGTAEPVQGDGTAVGISQFYRGKPKAQAQALETDGERERRETVIKDRHEVLLQKRAQAWKTLISDLGFSRLGLDDRECVDLLGDRTIREQMTLAIIETLYRTRSWIVMESHDPRFARDKSSGIIIKETGELLPSDAKIFMYVEAVDSIHRFLVDSVLSSRFPALLESPMLRQLVKNTVSGQIKPNFERDDKESELQKEKAAQTVETFHYRVFDASSAIIQRGETVQAWHVSCLGKAFSTSVDASDQTLLAGLSLEYILSLAALFVLVSMMVLIPYFTLHFERPQVLMTRRDRLLAALLLLFQVLLFVLVSFISDPLKAAFPNLSEASLLVGVPVSVTPMLIRALVGRPLALISIISVSLLAPLTFPGLNPPGFGGTFQAYYAAYVLLCGLMGIIQTRKVSSRSVLARAGVVVGVSGVVFWMLVFFLNIRSGGGSWQLQIVIASLVAGLLSYVFAIALVPTFETFFGYLTDMKLMEYINMNHPALKELADKARGTYDHSAAVAKLVEVACEEIGANTLLAKAGALFHDLGKLEAKDSPMTEKKEGQGRESALYFVENQSDSNPHDNLSPLMSARIIKRHVAKSLEKIRRFNLGREIEDIAAQHHGTTIMQYFYQRAVEQAGDESLVDPNDFRYPGPKPRTKEAGVVMLADTVEAAIRTLQEHNEASIREKVEQLINEKIQDRQLDECPLTFEEFGKIREAFVKTLAATYHGRVAYPDRRREQLTVRMKKSEIDDKDLLGTDGPEQPEGLKNGEDRHPV